MVRRRDAPPYAASTRNAARPSGCTCAQSFAGGAWGAGGSIGGARGGGGARAWRVGGVAGARGMGHREMVGDTIPQMAEALAMYDRAGFERTGPYAEAPTPGAIYLRLKL